MRMTPEQLQDYERRQRGFVDSLKASLGEIARTAQDRKPREKHEEQKQISLLEWSQFVSVGPWSLYDLLYHVPNGGYRNAGEAARFKAMGVKAGYPDVCLDIASGEFHGARWEMKHGDGRLSDSQKKRHEMLRQAGYYVNTYWQWEHCASDIIRYLSGQERFLIVVRAPVPL